METTQLNVYQIVEQHFTLHRFSRVLMQSFIDDVMHCLLGDTNTTMWQPLDDKWQHGGTNNGRRESFSFAKWRHCSRHAGRIQTVVRSRSVLVRLPRHPAFSWHALSDCSLHITALPAISWNKPRRTNQRNDCTRRGPAVLGSFQFVPRSDLLRRQSVGIHLIVASISPEADRSRCVPLQTTHDYQKSQRQLCSAECWELAVVMRPAQRDVDHSDNQPHNQHDRSTDEQGRAVLPTVSSDTARWNSWINLRLGRKLVSIHMLNIDLANQS